MARKKLKPAAVVEAVKKTRGLVYLAAKRLGVHTNTVFNYARDYPAVQRAINEARGQLGDVAEARLIKAVKAGESWAIQFFLKMQCKDRGYVERSEHTGAGGGEIVVKVLGAGTSMEDL